MNDVGIVSATVKESKREQRRGK